MFRVLQLMRIFTAFVVQSDYILKSVLCQKR